MLCVDLFIRITKKFSLQILDVYTFFYGFLKFGCFLGIFKLNSKFKKDWILKPADGPIPAQGLSPLDLPIYSTRQAKRPQRTEWDSPAQFGNSVASANAERHSRARTTSGHHARGRRGGAPTDGSPMT
jgi:hypothetical protein